MRQHRRLKRTIQAVAGLAIGGTVLQSGCAFEEARAIAIGIEAAAQALSGNDRSNLDDLANAIIRDLFD